MQTSRAAIKMFLFFLWSLCMVPPQIVLLAFHTGQGAYLIPNLWHRGVCKIFGIRFRIEGIPHTATQTLYVSNHLSYLDIPVIGSVLKSSFLAKKEVEAWPVFGFLSKLQQTAFIERRRTAIQKETQMLDSRIKAGRSLILFPEGTSTDGQNVLPFKSSLFTLAMQTTNENLHVQPMTLRLGQVDGHAPQTQDDRDLYAWHRDMETELPLHLWRFGKTRGAVIVMTFHPPLKASLYTDRKALAKECHDNVSKGLGMALAA